MAKPTNKSEESTGLRLKSTRHFGVEADLDGKVVKFNNRGHAVHIVRYAGQGRLEEPRPLSDAVFDFARKYPQMYEIVPLENGERDDDDETGSTTDVTPGISSEASAPIDTEATRENISQLPTPTRGGACSSNSHGVL
jgi:hypothetical protein